MKPEVGAIFHEKFLSFSQFLGSEEVESRYDVPVHRLCEFFDEHGVVVHFAFEDVFLTDAVL